MSIINQPVLFNNEELEKIQREVDRKIIKDLLYAHRLNQLRSCQMPDIKFLLDAKAEKDERCTSTHVFITINPKDIVTENGFTSIPHKFIDKVHSLSTRKWIPSILYTFEQRATIKENVYRGYHAHILIERGTKAPSEIKREIKKTFRKFVATDKHIDFKWITVDAVPNMVSYIKDHNKSDPNKEGKILMDIEMRADLELESYYATGTFV